MSAIDVAAARLWDAAATSVPCDPVRDVIEAGDEAAAYAVAERNVERARAELGWHVSGRKIGLTSAAVQAQLCVDRPDYGALFAELGHGDGEEVPVATLLQPRIETEVAIVLGADLDVGDPSLADVAAATDHVRIALEIVDSRIAGWDITFVDTVADRASAGRYVLGAERVGLDGVDGLDGLDLAAVTMSMTVNGTVRSTGSGAACLGSPLVAAQWLAATMARLGTPLRAGDVVLTGALGPMVPVVAGDRVEAVIGGLGRVGVSFTGDSAMDGSGGDGDGGGDDGGGPA